MSGTGLFEGILLLVVAHITLAVMCLSTYEQQQRMWPGSRIQYSLVDLFLLTCATALTISIWSYYALPAYYEPTAKGVGFLVFVLSHQFVGILFMRLQPRGFWKKYEFLQSVIDVLIGSLIGIFVMTLISAIGVLTFFLWFPIWLIFRLRKWRESKAAARENVRA
jgi:hypothetical protein